MSFPEWSLVIGVLMSLATALCPWMVAVHAKLAVIASKMADLCDTLDRANTEHRKLWELLSKHQSRLDTHDVQLSHIAERLRESNGA